MNKQDPTKKNRSLSRETNTTLAGLMMLALPACALTPDEVDTSSIEGDATVAQWLDDVQIPNQMSARQPALAQYGTKLYMVHNGSSSPNDLWWSTFDGMGWSTNVKLTGLESDGGPALAAYAGKLYLAFHAAGKNEIDISTTTASAWTTPVAVLPRDYVTFQHAPSAAVYGQELYVASCFTANNTGNQGIAIEAFDGASWTESVVDTTEETGTCEGVALQVIGGTLHLLTNWHWQYTYLGMTLIDETDLYEHVVAPTSAALSSPPMHSRHPVALTTCNNDVFMVHSGDSNPSEIWTSYQPLTGGGWATNVKLTDQTSDAGAGLGCLDTTPIMAHNGGTNQLWWASYR